MSKCQCTNVTNQWSSESNQSEEEQFVFRTLNYEHPVTTPHNNIDGSWPQFYSSNEDNWVAGTINVLDITFYQKLLLI